MGNHKGRIELFVSEQKNQQEARIVAEMVGSGSNAGVGG